MGNGVPAQRFHCGGGLAVGHQGQGHDQLALDRPGLLSQGRGGVLGLALGNCQERLGPFKTGDRFF